MIEKQINIKIDSYFQILDKDVKLYTGNLNVYKFMFDLPEELKELTCIIVFTTKDDTSYKRAIIDDYCYVPFEALQKGNLKIGFYAYKDDKLIYSIKPTVISVLEGSYVEESETEKQFEQNDYERYLELNNQILIEVQELYEKIKQIEGVGGIVEETDPTVPQHVKNITEEDIEKWNSEEIPETLYALGADYAEYFEWEDGNPNNEDRTSLFVSIVYGTRKIKKAMVGEDILGITSIDASIIGNARYKDESTYSAVGMTGVMKVKDNGKCQIGDYVIPGDNGLAIPSSNNVGYKVTARYSKNLIEVLMAHDSEMISRLKDDVQILDNALKEKATLTDMTNYIEEHKEELKGADGKDGSDGYTPVKGKDYFDGKDGVNGSDGYTPIKGKDYFDGKDGTNGVDGKTPVKGQDYYTEADKQEMVNLVLEALPSSEEVSY